MMGRRLSALVVALFVVAEPAARAACEVVCAEGTTHASHPVTAAVPHSCHETLPTDAPAMTGSVPVCGHGDGLPSAVDRPVVRTVPVSDMAVTGPAPLLYSASIIPRSRAATSSPPGHTHLLAPLRI